MHDDGEPAHTNSGNFDQFSSYLFYMIKTENKILDDVNIFIILQEIIHDDGTQQSV